jgi:hypothetical protein
MAMFTQKVWLLRALSNTQLIHAKCGQNSDQCLIWLISVPCAALLLIIQSILKWLSDFEPPNKETVLRTEVLHLP